MKLDKKQKTKIRKIIRNEFGHCNMTKIKKYLKDKSVYEYGCYFSEIKLKNGLVRLSYTSNDNCFARYLITLKCIGFSDTSALTKNDITKAGKKRGCGNYFVF